MSPATAMLRLVFSCCILLPPVMAAGQDPPVAAAPAPGEFGSEEAPERADLPTRGVLSFNLDETNKDKIFVTGEHWEQYNFPFKAKRWGKYSVRIRFMLKGGSLGVQLKFGEERLKKQLPGTEGKAGHAWLGEFYVPAEGDQFMALYTPNNVGWNTFELLGIDLVPASEGSSAKQNADGSIELLAKDATTWSEHMRYEPKPEKDCLGYWTLAEDFAEWEFTVDKPGIFKAMVHAGSKPGGSDIEIELSGQKLKFTATNTGDIHKAEAMPAGEVKIDKPGICRLSLKPKSKNGGAVMDLKKIVLTPLP